MLWILFTGNSFLSFQCLFMIFLGVIRLLATHLRSFLTILLKSEVSEHIMTKLFFFLFLSFLPFHVLSWVLLFHPWIFQHPFWTLWTFTSSHTGHNNDSSTCHHPSSQIWSYRVMLSISAMCKCTGDLLLWRISK